MYNAATPADGQATVQGDGTLLIPQPGGADLEMARPDVVLASTIVYDEEHGEMLPGVLATLVRPGGCVHLANHTAHAGHATFLQGMLDVGFEEIHSEVVEVQSMDGQEYSPVRLNGYRLL